VTNDQGQAPKAAPSLGIAEDHPDPANPRIRRWTLHRSERRNALAPEDFRWIAQSSARLSGEVVILRGQGDTAFCAGFDLTKLSPEGSHAQQNTSGEPNSPELPDHSLVVAMKAMVAADATFIAGINGYAIGAGVELAATCDFRLAVRHSSFRVPAGKLGVIYHAAGLARIRNVFGPAATRRLIIAGETLSAQQADDAGALHSVVLSEMLDDASLLLAQRITSLAPQSVSQNRRLLRAMDSIELPSEALQRHASARTRAYASADHKEARAAQSERRPPRFTGD